MWAERREKQGGLKGSAIVYARFFPSTEVKHNFGKYIYMNDTFAQKIFRKKGT